jgi:alkylation response protein AidB-like acyl-CoA dehydrogenase
MNYSNKVRELQQRVSAFMEKFVYPESRFQDDVAKNRHGGNSHRLQLGKLELSSYRSA